MNGKDKCELLKGIREQIAQENDIELESEECTFEGDCTGTCPKCEDELRYLENEINKKDGKIKEIDLLEKILGEDAFTMGQIQVKFRRDTDEIYDLEGLPVDDYWENADEND